LSDQQDKQEIGYLERVNAELTSGLRRCHVLVRDYRKKLMAANSNEPPFMLVPNDDESQEEAQPDEDDERRG
jgi:hypothetical protein